jgi:hypothetical protein
LYLSAEQNRDWADDFQAFPKFSMCTQLCFMRKNRLSREVASHQQLFWKQEESKILLKNFVFIFLIPYDTFIN